MNQPSLRSRLLVALCCVVAGLVAAPLQPALADTALKPASWGYIDARQPYTSFLNPAAAPSAGAFRDAARKRHVTRSFFTYDLSALREANITGATFRLQQIFSTDCVARPVELWTSGPFTSANTWQNPPAQLRLLDTRSTAAGGGAGCPAAAVTFTVGDAVRQALSGGVLTLELRVPAEVESDYAYGKRFATDPELLLTVESAPTAPHAPVGLYVSSAPGLAAQFCDSSTIPLSRTARPVLGVSSGAPAYNTDRPNLRAAFEVTRPDGQVLFTQSVAFVGSAASLQMPEGILVDGDYRVRARAEDGAAVSEWLPWCAYRVDTSTSGSAPGVPDTLRISTGPYAGFQQCAIGPVMAVGDSATFAANPTPWMPGVTYPNLSATFEIGQPGQDPLIRRTEPIWPSGLVFAIGVAPGTLAPGSYQFRVQAVDGTLTSPWSPWCAFTVTP